MSRTYFSSLNYTLANEDTAIELALLPPKMPHVLAVAGSGGRVLPLFAKSPKRITCVDLSPEQLYLTELRVQSATALEFSEFMEFWGYPPRDAEPKIRRNLFQRIHLSKPCRIFFEELFEARDWESILYTGKWEQTMAALSWMNRRVTGPKGMGLFSAMSYSQHQYYLKNKFPKYKWNAVVAVLGNSVTFNSLLYKGHFPKKNIPGSSYEFYSNVFRRIFNQGPARQNFLLQLLFFGKIIFEEGNPIECNPRVFAEIKAGLKRCKVSYVKGNVIEVVEGLKTPAGFLSLSDVPSYFSGTTETQFMQRLKPGVSSDGLVVIRNYLRIPEKTDFTDFRRETKKHAALISSEKMQVYSIEVFRKKAKGVVQ